MLELVWEKAEEQEIKLPTVQGSFQIFVFFWVSFLPLSLERSLSFPSKTSVMQMLVHLLLYKSLAAAAATLLQSCLTLRDPIDGSPSGSAIPGILQARTQEWVAISFSNASKWKVKVKAFSRVQLLATPWTAAYQAPLSTGFSRQEYWSGLPVPSPISLLSYLY